MTFNTHFESTFPDDYRKEDIENILKLIQAGRFCQLLSLPGGGKATLLKLLAFNQGIKEFHLKEKKDQFLFIYLNLLELPNLEQATIDKFVLLSIKKAAMQQFSNETMPTDPLLLSQRLKEIVSKITGGDNQAKTLILLFDHFDEFQNQLPQSFFQTLRSLKSLAKYRFSCVFATRRNLSELVDSDLLKNFYDFFVDNMVYMRLYDKQAMAFMLSQIEKTMGKKLEEKIKNKLIKLTGGHTKLLKVCFETVLLKKTNVVPDSLLEKQIIKACLYELWLFLTPQEQQILVHSATWKVTRQRPGLLPGETDFLKNIGLVKDNKITILLFEEFVKQIASVKKEEHFSFNPETKEITKGSTVVSDLLSPLEFRLLWFLIENKERIIERDEIINAVWHYTKSTQGVTDQAIDQLIFRLRKKIEDNPNSPTHLQTIKGRGIKFLS